MTTNITINLPIKTSPHGGEKADLKSVVAKDVTACILCYNKGDGLVPLKIIPVDQCYVDDLCELCRKTPGITEFTAIPITDYINIAKV